MQPESQQAAAVLQTAGIKNPRRLVSLMRQAIDTLALDLSGLTVLTEAASGSYVVTPVLAAAAGAERVIAVTADSPYATAAEVRAQTEALLSLCDLQPTRVEIHDRRSLQLFGEADVVTNLGFVRPIDAAGVALMRRDAVVALMCEAWEWRPQDVDLAALTERGIAVVGTNEDHDALRVFDYSGPLAQKLLLDAHIELHRSRVVVVGTDKFGRVIHEHLRRSGTDVRLVPNLRGADWRAGSPDAVIVADYTRTDEIVGPKGDISGEDLAEAVPGITVVQFAGRIDVADIKARGIAVHPGSDLPPRRMSLTLAALGPRPVVDLHAGGLKAAQLMRLVRDRGAESLPDRDRAHLPLLQPLAPGTVEQGADHRGRA